MPESTVYPPPPPSGRMNLATDVLLWPLAWGLNLKKASRLSYTNNSATKLILSAIFSRSFSIPWIKDSRFFPWWRLEELRYCMYLCTVQYVPMYCSGCWLSGVPVGGCCLFLFNRCRLLECWLSGVGCRSHFLLSMPSSGSVRWSPYYLCGVSITKLMYIPYCILLLPIIL
jgi:hypothetical protein